MTNSYLFATKGFQTILDYIRFGLSKAQANHVVYGHGTDNAWDDMLVLICEVLNLPRDVDPCLFQARLTEEEKKLLCKQLEQRIIHRIPVPYLINKAYFCELPFYVDPRVLIPRSPIAELIKQQFSPWISEEKVQRVLDLCTGSGCIAIACCHAFPDAKVDATDISEPALEVAEINRQNYELEMSLNLMKSDGFSEVPPVRYDIIVSNPPYVSQEELETLPAEYHHEPKLALHAEENGLAIVEKILHQAKNYLNEHGILVVEVGNSEEMLVNLYPQVPFTWLEFEFGGHGVFLLSYDQLKQYF